MDVIEAQRYDRGMEVLERLRLTELRRELLHGIAGAVLEIGTGTGANIGRYERGVQVTAIDLRVNYLRRAVEKSAEARPGVTFAAVGANVQSLPFQDGCFDSVVGSLVFCSIAEPHAALREICRVLKVNGRLHLLEHVRGQNVLSRALTDILHPLWFAMQGECHLNRETAATVAAAGFTLEQTSTHGGGLLQMIKATAPAPCAA